MISSQDTQLDAKIKRKALLEKFTSIWADTNDYNSALHFEIMSNWNENFQYGMKIKDIFERQNWIAMLFIIKETANFIFIKSKHKQNVN